jgi:hypothetical protein
VLLAVTTELAPIAVALVMPAAPFELTPIKVLLFSAVLESPELRPKKLLPVPVVLFRPALVPKNELSLALVLRPALAPKNELARAVVLNSPAV